MDAKDISFLKEAARYCSMRAAHAWGSSQRDHWDRLCAWNQAKIAECKKALKQREAR